MLLQDLRAERSSREGSLAACAGKRKDRPLVRRELRGPQQQGKRPAQGKGAGSCSQVSSTQSPAALWVTKTAPGAYHAAYLHGLQLRV